MTSSNTNLFTSARFQENLKPIANNSRRQWQWRAFRIGLVVIDFLSIGLAFLLSYYIRFELSIAIFQLGVDPSYTFYQTLSLALIPVWLFLIASYGLYNRNNLLGGTVEYARVFNAATTGMILVIFFSFIVPGFILARGWLLLSWFLSFLFTALSRFFYRRVIYQLRKRGYFLSPAIIVGANNEGISLADQFTDGKTSGLEVIGFVDKKLPADTQVFQQKRILGSVDQLEEIIQMYQVEEVILASSSITSRDRMTEIFQRYGIASDVNLRISSGLYEIITTGISVKEFAYVPLVEINKVRLTGFDHVLKLLLDYFATIPLFIATLPLSALIALAIKLDSDGPIFYRRRVLGMHGRQFDAYKFRTMHVNGDMILDDHPELKSELALNHKLKQDPRVTRVGAFLRKTSLDELPQFVNVLKREMSLVGPRMITLDELENYDKWYMNLLTVRPGITGYWQVKGRSDVPYEERVRLDMHYIRNWSIWFDLQLLIQTIPAVLRRRGAY